MAFSLTSYNSSEFSIFRSNFADSSDFTVGFNSFPDSSLEGFTVSLNYASTNEYYFTVQIDGQSVPYDYEVDNFRITMRSGEGYAYVKFDYSPELFVQHVSGGLDFIQTINPPAISGGNSDNGGSSVSLPRMPSLNGNGSRYRDGSIVKVTTLMDEFKVAWSGLVRTDANIYTIFYDLLRKMPDGEFSELHCVPESLVYLDSEIETGS